MPVEIIRLHFKTPLHIGRGAAELDRTSALYHSDALKSALYAVGLSYHPEWVAEPSRFFNAFKISSAFPFCGDELFVPKPFYKIQFDFAKTAVEKQAKKAKKISFISLALFEEWLRNSSSPLKLIEGQVSAGGSYLFQKEANNKPFLHAEIQQRVQVTIDNEGDSRPFYFERLYFEEHAGLYFFAEFSDAVIRQQVLQTLRLLGALGIGTDRTVGNGLFEFNEDLDVSTARLPENPQGKLHINLGLYLPRKEELEKIQLPDSYWQLIKRGGYIAGSSQEKHASLRKNNIYFFAEGSVLHSDSVPVGRYTDLRPAYNDASLHPVYRSGQPLFITF